MSGVHLLTRAQVCDLLGVSPRTINHWVQHGRFPRPLKLNGDRLARWRSDEVQEWIDAQPHGE